MTRRAIRFSQLLALICFLVAGAAALRHFWAHAAELSGEELKLVLGFLAAGVCLSYPKLFFGWAVAMANRWTPKSSPPGDQS